MLKNENVLVARTLCSCDQEDSGLPAELLNPMDDTVVLHQGTTLGVLAPVGDREDIQVQPDHVRTTVGTDLPEELEKLVMGASQVLNDGDLERLRRLVGKY